MHDAMKKLLTVHGMQSVLVEGGANIIQSVLEHGLASQVPAKGRSYHYI